MVVIMMMGMMIMSGGLTVQHDAIMIIMIMIMIMMVVIIMIMTVVMMMIKVTCRKERWEADFGDFGDLTASSSSFTSTSCRFLVIISCMS